MSASFSQHSPNPQSESKDYRKIAEDFRKELDQSVKMQMEQ